jgi:hypothetical protein
VSSHLNADDRKKLTETLRYAKMSRKVFKLWYKCYLTNVDSRLLSVLYDLGISREATMHYYDVSSAHYTNCDAHGNRIND